MHKGGHPTHFSPTPANPEVKLAMLTEDGLGDGELWGGLDTRAQGIKGGPGIGIYGCPEFCLFLVLFLGPSLLYSMYMHVMYVYVLFQQLGKGPVGFSPHSLCNGRVGGPFSFLGLDCLPGIAFPDRATPIDDKDLLVSPSNSIKNQGQVLVFVHDHEALLREQRAPEQTV